MRAMKTEDAKKHFGNGTRLAEALGVWHTTVYQWGEYPPEGRQYQIEVITGGALKAERNHPRQAGSA